MRALILDMYGVVMKDPECSFMPFVNRAFPDLSCEEIYKHWNKADLGEMSSLDLTLYCSTGGMSRTGGKPSTVSKNLPIC